MVISGQNHSIVYFLVTWHIKKKMKQTPPATRVNFIFKKLAIIAT